MHTDWISSSLSDSRVCCVVATFTSDEELSRASQSDSGLRSVAECNLCCMWWPWSHLSCSFSHRALSQWLAEMLHRNSGSSSSRQSDCNRSRKPHLEWHGVLVSEGSDENFLNECELWKVGAVLASAMGEWYRAADANGSSDRDRELDITLTSEDMSCISENTKLGFNLYKLCNTAVISAKLIHVLHLHSR